MFRKAPSLAAKRRGRRSSATPRSPEGTSGTGGPPLWFPGFDTLDPAFSWQVSQGQDGTRWNKVRQMDLRNGGPCMPCHAMLCHVPTPHHTAFISSLVYPFSWNLSICGITSGGDWCTKSQEHSSNRGHGRQWSPKIARWQFTAVANCNTWMKCFS